MAQFLRNGRFVGLYKAGNSECVRDVMRCQQTAKGVSIT